ncbi:MAG: phytanoyl-CoA dioxygenase family protein, partial [Sphingopyxis sp.]
LTIPVEMEAGDVVFYSGKVIHGGGTNRTKDVYRRAITMPLLVGFLTPEEAFPLTMRLESAKTMTPRAQRLVGYRTHQTGGEHGVALWASNFADVGEALGL